MSGQLAAEVFRRVPRGTARDVLVVFALHANADGSEAWPSRATVAEMVDCGHRTVDRHVRAWRDAGVLILDRKPRPVEGKGSFPNVYRVDVTRLPPRVASSSDQVATQGGEFVGLDVDDQLAISGDQVAKSKDQLAISGDQVATAVPRSARERPLDRPSERPKERPASRVRAKELDEEDNTMDWLKTARRIRGAMLRKTKQYSREDALRPPEWILKNLTLEDLATLDHEAEEIRSGKQSEQEPSA
jgi:hypothetical protein